VKYDKVILMDPEIEKLLREDLVLNKENNEMLKKLYNAHKWNRISSILKWVIVIGIALGTFYFIQPMFDQLFSVYGISFSDVENMIKK